MRRRFLVFGARPGASEGVLGNGGEISSTSESIEVGKGGPKKRRIPSLEVYMCAFSKREI